MSKKMIIWTIGFTLLLCGGAMAGMLYFAAHKSIAVTEISSSGKDYAKETEQEAEKVSELHFQKKEEEAEYLFIPLPEGITAESVSVENRYLQQELWVYINGGSGDFYRTEALYGNDNAILAGDCRTAENGVVIRLKLKREYECVSTVGNGRLSVKFCAPDELYSRIAVVDFLPKNEWEERVLAGVGDALRAKKTEADTKIYYLDGDTALTEEEKLSLLAEWQPDFLLRLSVGESENTADYGVECYYPAEYFIPGFGNIAFADLLEKQTAEALQTRANGLFAADEDDLLLQTCGIPCGRLQLGYGSNTSERKQLSETEQQEKIADAVYAAFLEAWQQCGK